MKRKTKWLMRFVTVLMFVLFTLNASVVIYASVESEDVLMDSFVHAAGWLKSCQAENGAWGDDRLVNDTCDVCWILEDNKMAKQNSFLMETENIYGNCDALSRYVKATGSKMDFEKLLEMQNCNGGFGLNQDYQSDILDSLLVLESYNEREELKKKGISTVEKLVTWLIRQQKSDGGWAWKEEEDSDFILTARIGVAIQNFYVMKQNNYKEKDMCLKKTDTYIKEKEATCFSEESFEKVCYRLLYGVSRGWQVVDLETKKKILMIQNENGSFFNDIGKTILGMQVLKVLINKQLPDLHIKRLYVYLDTYVVETGSRRDVNIKGNIEYSLPINEDVTLKTTVLDGKRLVYSNETKVLLQAEDHKMPFEIKGWNVFGEEEKNFCITVSLFQNEMLVKEESCQLKLIDNGDVIFHLSDKVTQGKDYSINLNWNEGAGISDRYRYRVLREKEQSGWKSLSSWNGNEVVKVLNVYPCFYAKDYLKTWLENTVSEESMPAGMHMFDIDTVYIEDFNEEPNRYLLDDRENYRYDVLFFGSYDSNDGKDLSEESYDATKEFVDTGHGVLFGHDTITTVQLHHIWFGKFENMLGIHLSNSECYAFHPEIVRNRVKVVNSGFLTSYPWKLKGNLTIPYTHTAGQLTGGKLPATVWMELDGDYIMNEDTQEKNNAYLVTNNQFAMIQTGHSRGQATDDERKIIANTLFYLKQSTKDTCLVDQSFLDEKAPLKPKISDLLLKNREEFSSLSVKLFSEDRGTNYRYYVEGSQYSSSQVCMCSNIVNTQALSGVKGFAIVLNESAHSLESEWSSETEEAKNGYTIVSYKHLCKGKTYYLHACAVDWVGNRSEEFIQKITVPMDEDSCDIVSSVTVDNTEYKHGEKVHVTIQTNGVQECLTGQLEVIDNQGNIVCVLSQNVMMGKKTYVWNPEGVMSGKYEVRLRWYQKGKIYQEEKESFFILNDGTVHSKVFVEQSDTLEGSFITIIEQLKNTSTNTNLNELTADVIITDNQNQIVEEQHMNLPELPYGSHKTVIKKLFISNWKEDTYKVEIKIRSNEKILSDSKTVFTFNKKLDYEGITGKIYASDSMTAKKCIMRYQISSHSEEINEDTKIRIMIYQLNSGKMIRKFLPELSENFVVGSTYNGEKEMIFYEEGRYLAVLSTITRENQQRVLDKVVWNVEKKRQEETLASVYDSGYVLYSSGGSIQIHSNNTKIMGDVMANGDMHYQGSVLHLDGMCQSVRNIEIAGWKTFIKNRQEYVNFIKIPDYSIVIEQEFRECADTKIMDCYMGQVEKRPVLCNCAVGDYREKISFTNSLVSTGDIVFNSNIMETGMEKKSLLCSLNGDITIHATTARLNGIIYCPNGMVTIQASDLLIHGAILAKEIQIQGTKVCIRSNE